MSDYHITKGILVFMGIDSFEARKAFVEELIHQKYVLQEDVDFEDPDSLYDVMYDNSFLITNDRIYTVSIQESDSVNDGYVKTNRVAGVCEFTVVHNDSVTSMDQLLIEHLEAEER